MFSTYFNFITFSENAIVILQNNSQMTELQNVIFMELGPTLSMTFFIAFSNNIVLWRSVIELNTSWKFLQKWI